MNETGNTEGAPLLSTVHRGIGMSPGSLNIMIALIIVKNWRFILQNIQSFCV